MTLVLLWLFSCPRKGSFQGFLCDFVFLQLVGPVLSASWALSFLDLAVITPLLQILTVITPPPIFSL